MMRYVRAGCTVGFLSLLLVALATPMSARAGDQSKEIQQLRKEVEQLRQEVEMLKGQQPAQPAPSHAGQPVAPTAAPTARAKEPVITVKNGGLQVGPVNIRPGGFIEAAGIYRTKNEVADVGSDFNQGIPFQSSHLANENETRFSARQSRLSLLITGDVAPETRLAGYYEMDFLASGVTSNSRESFSYTPRSRQLWTTLDKDDWGFHLLGGQAWSLMTTNTEGIIPRKEQIPLTIDAQYVVGFNWLRVPQFRVVEDFGSGIWAGLSLESPQIVTSPITAPTKTCAATQGNLPCVNYTNPGNSAGLLNSSTTYSNDHLPDFLAKLAADPGYGHYELKGILRTFSVQAGHSTNNTQGYGVGGAAAMPIIPSYLDLQLSGLWGSGIGRYASGQLPDAAFASDLRNLDAVKEWQALVGLIGHPWWGNDLYVYGGWEHADSTGSTAVFLDKTGKFAGAPGYGSPKLVVGGCDTLGGTCEAQTEQLREITVGTWQDIYRGDYGRFTLGLQGAEFWRDAFAGVGGQPRTNVAVFMTSLRYYPNP